MPEKSNLLEPKLTFAELGIKLMVAKPLQNCSEMFLVLVFALGVNEDVINEHHHKFVQEIHKHLVHHMHEEGWGLSEAEGHNGILIKTVLSGERGLGNILLLYFELMISGPQINFGEYFGPTEFQTNRQSLAVDTCF